jgi:hypothetical protein
MLSPSPIRTSSLRDVAPAAEIVEPKAEGVEQADGGVEASEDAKRFIHAVRNALFAAQLDLHTLRKVVGNGSLSRDAVDELIGECERHIRRAESEVDKFNDAPFSIRRED